MTGMFQQRVLEFSIAFGLIVSTFWADRASAEIFRCNGIYTNDPDCPAAKTPVLDEVNRSSAPSEMSRKRSLVHELRMKNLNAQSEYRVFLNLRETEILCLDPKSTIEDCRKDVEAQDEKLEHRIIEHAKLKAEKKVDDAPAKRVQQNQTSVSISQPRVVVSNIGNGSIVIGGRRIITGAGTGYGVGTSYGQGGFIPPTGPRQPITDLPSLSPGGARVTGSVGQGRVPLSQLVPLGQ